MVGMVTSDEHLLDPVPQFHGDPPRACFAISTLYHILKQDLSERRDHVVETGRHGMETSLVGSPPRETKSNAASLEAGRDTSLDNI